MTAAKTAPSRPQRSLEQKRSRDRQAAILEVASALIAADGSDHLKMSAIAATAGISIGSLYQYYPDKSAVIRALAERYNADSRRCIEEAFAGVATKADLTAAFSALLDQFYTQARSEPVMRDIWGGMQADKTLMALQTEESRAMAAVLAATWDRVEPGDPDRRAASTFLIWELGEAAVRLAISGKDAFGGQLIEAYKRMALHEMDLG